MNLMPEFVDYDRQFLNKSWDWLHDPEIKQLTMTPDFTKEDQEKWFNGLSQKSDYLIWGIRIYDQPIGVCGIKNISDHTGEYWGYIGEKQYWNQGLGKKILDHTVTEAVKRSLTLLYLKVWDQNTRAIRLYEKYGFVLQASNDHLLQMTKKIG